MANRLAGAASPYLLQHSGNPVDWYPWGDEAFAAARARDLPIFLSVGYSTCHWCHVMAHESFEDEAVASELNAGFIPVKLDREERPDIDRVYMSYLQAITGQGGWPLSVWMTPELKPFYAGTYFPPTDRNGRPGFTAILRAIARGWREDRGHVVAEAEKVVRALSERAAPPPANGAPAPLAAAAGAAFEKAYQYYAENFDSARGGFGGAPKFPRPANLEFLLRCVALQGLSSEAGLEAAGMVSGTLAGMARGGIHDHVGGGFHRYSVDDEWFVPHFEKMLYDQAQLASCALGAWQATADERHAWLARDIISYVLRDLADPEGGFYAAEDADSARADGSPPVEGAFYVWSSKELEQVLGEDAGLLSSHFGAKAPGNVAPARDPHGDFSGFNILAQSRPVVETARLAGIDPQAASDRITGALGRLLDARKLRPRPHLDDKVVAGWNGLMISALARASIVPAESIADQRATYLEAALKAAGFVMGRLLDRPGPPRRSWRRGTGSGPGFAEDCAFLVQAWLDLYDATFDVAWIERARELQRVLDEGFWDEKSGGYFNSAEGAVDVIVRLKEDYDGAEPAASSAAALNLFRLSLLLSDDSLRERGRGVIAAFRSRWESTPHAMPQLLCAFESALEAPRHVVLTGDPGSQGFASLAAVLRSRIDHRRAVIALDAPGARKYFSEKCPWLASMGSAAADPTAFVCEEFVCRSPASSAADLRKALAFSDERV